MTFPQSEAPFVPYGTGRARFLEKYPVPQETIHRLERYESMLIDWNQRHNLVAARTLSDVWIRHFLDSAQLFPLIKSPETARLVDLGSGAGFPALVLSILGVGETHCFESTGKKARFLEEVARVLSLPVVVHNERIEAARPLRAHVVTARALAPLPDLLRLAKPFMRAETAALFLKGEKVEAELTAARKYWTFGVEKTCSLTSQNGTILHIFDLKARRKNDGIASCRSL